MNEEELEEKLDKLESQILTNLKGVGAPMAMTAMTCALSQILAQVIMHHDEQEVDYVLGGTCKLLTDYTHENLTILGYNEVKN